MQCPRDGATLIEERVHGIEVDRCPTCHGRWLDHDELGALEATRAKDEDDRSGTIQWSNHESTLECPVCGRLMTAFNYRSYDLELDTCDEEHGFWLDSGEDGRIRDVIAERVRGLDRAAQAEEAWGDFLRGVGSGGVMNGIRSFFGRRSGRR